MTLVKVIGLTGGAVLLVAGAVLYTAFGAFLPWREEAEAARLGALAGVAPGATVAEIGAGGGRFTLAMARRVGSAGRVYSTELDDAQQQALRERASAAGLANVTVVAGASDRTNLPERCCDVVFMRNVFHHVADPPAFAASVAAAVRPGGRVVVIDFEPGGLWFHRAAPGRHAAHGVSRADAIAAFVAAGLETQVEDPDWGGPMWMAAFRRPAPTP